MKTKQIYKLTLLVLSLLPLSANAEVVKPNVAAEAKQIVVAAPEATTEQVPAGTSADLKSAEAQPAETQEAQPAEIQEAEALVSEGQHSTPANATQNASAADGKSAKSKNGLMKDFDSLGGNDVLLEKAKALNPETRVRVVQNRIVSRRYRFEIAPEYSSVLGGDPYNKTQNIGANVHFHFNPYWSLGVKYGYSFNELRPEGHALITDPNVSARPLIADIDYPKTQVMALINFYPFYGKLNIFDLGVAHFDVYAIAGYGSIELKSGRHPTYTGGGGVGFWISQHVSARAEVRYQGFKATHYNGEVSMDTTVLAVQIGYLL